MSGHVCPAFSHAAVLPFDSITVSRYYFSMIKGFADKETEKLWRRERSKAVPTELQRVALRKLTQLHSSGRLGDLAGPPGNRLEPLVGKRKGQHSIRINDKFRVCFVWEDGDAYDVEVTDYH